MVAADWITSCFSQNIFLKMRTCSCLLYWFFSVVAVGHRICKKHVFLEEEPLVDSAAFMRLSAGTIFVLLFSWGGKLHIDSIWQHKTTHFYYLQPYLSILYHQSVHNENTLSPDFSSFHVHGEYLGLTKPVLTFGHYQFSLCCSSSLSIALYTLKKISALRNTYLYIVRVTCTNIDFNSCYL